MLARDDMSSRGDLTLGVPAGPRRQGALPGSSRQPDGEAGPSARVVAGRQAAPLLAEDLGAEVEAVAAAPLLGREEWLEDPLEVRSRGCPGPSSLDVDLDPGALRLLVGLGAEVDRRLPSASLVMAWCALVSRLSSTWISRPASARTTGTASIAVHLDADTAILGGSPLTNRSTASRITGGEVEGLELGGPARTAAIR